MLSKIQNLLIPSFLKRLDFWLLTHKPHIWRTRGHFVVFYCLIAAFLLYFSGKMYPQNFADFHDGDYMRNNSVVFYLKSFLAFTSVGIIMWWWYSIQKFSYLRTNFLHFLTEIGIYTLGICSISLFIFSFDHGYSYRQAFQLEKNSREDSLWIVDNGLFCYGYMPHFQPNKESNLAEYFKKGENLDAMLYNRQAIVFNILKNEVKDNNDYINTSSTDAFSYSHWEYPKNQKNYTRPPQYQVPADYVNKILTNDTFWKQEEKRLKFKEDDNASREILTDMSYNEMTNLINEVYPKYFGRINHFSNTQSGSRALLNLWMAKRLFLESLSESEIKEYKEYLVWLKGNFALYAPQPILAFELNAAQGFFYKVREREAYSIDKEKDEYIFNHHAYSDEYFDDNKGELAGEKLLLLLKKIDFQSLKCYLDYLALEGYQSLIKANKKNPEYVSICKNYFSKYTPKSFLDSLYHYDYFSSNNINEHTWLNIIADEYAQFVTHKYSEKDYNRLRNALHLNSFEDVYTQSKNPTIQKLAQLHQVEDYSIAVNNMRQSRQNYMDNQKLTFSGFALTYCLFFAILFYITTLSNGLQFWISAFVSGFFVSILMFFQKILTEYSYRAELLLFQSMGSTNFYIMIFFSILILVLALILIFKKVQLQKAHIGVNTILFSSLLGIYGTLNYGVKTINSVRDFNLNAEVFDRYNASQYDQLDERIKVYTYFFLIIIGIYLIMAWLYKRHLTLPKKK